MVTIAIINSHKRPCQLLSRYIIDCTDFDDSPLISGIYNALQSDICLDGAMIRYNYRRVMILRFLLILLVTATFSFAQELEKNIVVDGGFESDQVTHAWEIKTDVPLPKALQPTLTIDPSTAKTGHSSLKIVIPEQEAETEKTFTLWWRTSFKTPLPQGTSLQIRGSLKLQKAAMPIKSNAYLALSILVTYADDTKKWEVIPKSKFSPASLDWQDVDYTWIAPQGIKHLTLCLVLPLEGQTIWLDDVSVIPSSP